MSQSVSEEVVVQPGLLPDGGVRLAAQPAWRRWAPWLAVVYVALLFAPVQLNPNLPLRERDGYYHARFAHVLPEIGFTREFRWTQASTWVDRYCDKEVLYHVAMVPFAYLGDEPLDGVRWYAWAMSVGVFGMLLWVMRRNGVPWAPFFTLLPLALGGYMLLRVCMIRSHVLSIILMTLGVHFLMAGRWRALAILGFVYAWSYTVPLALVMTAVPFVAGRWLGGGGLDWRSPLAAGVGVIAGLLIHPYSPNTLEMFLTLVKIMHLGGGPGSDIPMEVGGELYARSNTRIFVELYPLYVGLVAVLLVAGWRVGRRVLPETLGALCVALFWFGMTLFYERFMEYGMPLLALATGFVVRDAIQGVDVRALWQQLGLWRQIGAAGVLAVSLSLCHVKAMYEYYHCSYFADWNRTPMPPLQFVGATQWMDQNLAPAETVVHLNWHDFPDLFYCSTRQNFLWGLDPTFTLRFNPEMARALEETRTYKRPVQPAALAEMFNSRVLIARQADLVNFPALTSSVWQPVFADEFSAIYMLSGPHGPPADFDPSRAEKATVPWPPRALTLAGR